MVVKNSESFSKTKTKKKQNSYLSLLPVYFSLYIDQIRSVAQSCPTLCDPMNRSTPGLPVYHQLPEFTQTHLHRVSDAIQICVCVCVCVYVAYIHAHFKGIVIWLPHKSWNFQKISLNILIMVIEFYLQNHHNAICIPSSVIT